MKRSIRLTCLCLAVLMMFAAAHALAEAAPAPAGAPQVAFDSVTLAGEQVTGGVFAGYRLTAVNVWATWCGPCVREIPELAALHKALPEGVNLIGLCLDAADEPDLALKILEESGAGYMNVVGNDAMIKGFLAGVQAIPTTIFVDAEGNVVGENMVGAPSSDVVETYLAAIGERLALLDAAEARG